MAEQFGWWPFPWLNIAAPERLTQSILPDWSLQRVEVNFAGDVAVEKEVVAKVASYGKQLGILTEAVLALAGDAPQEQAQRLDRLRAIAAEVEKVKKEHKTDLAETAQTALQSLADADPAAAQRLAAKYVKTSTKTAA